MPRAANTPSLNRVGKNLPAPFGHSSIGKKGETEGCRALNDQESENPNLPNQRPLSSFFCSFLIEECPYGLAACFGNWPLRLRSA
jgi:hypothetical protein